MNSLAMSAVCEHYSSEEATLLAVQAGCVMILMPEEFNASFVALSKAVEDGVIRKERLDESVRKIIKAKMVMREKMFVHMKHERKRKNDSY